MEKSFLSRLVVFNLIFTAFLFAQTTGKIAGIVSDAASGDPVMGANIWLEGTEMGAATGEDGDYYIINVPPGTYTVNFQMMGYQKYQVEKVRISVNRTYKLNVELRSEAITSEAVVVTADRVSMKLDQTGSIQNISADDIALLPVLDVQEVVNMQAGVVAGSFRGGRRTEVSYLVEGLQVDESFGGEGQVVRLENEVIEDLEVITGTFNAEYGRAMSGVVNAIVKDGGKEFVGTASVAMATYLTSHDDIFEGINTMDNNLNQDYRIFLSGPAGFDALTFVANMRYQNNNNHLNGINRFDVNNYNNFENTNPNNWYSENTGDENFVAMNGSENLSGLAKLTAAISSSMKSSLLFTYNDDRWDDYDHAFKYNTDGMSSAYRESYMLAFQFNHMLGSSVFYELKLSYLDNFNGYYLFENPLDSNYVHDGYLRNDGYFFTGGQNKTNSKRYQQDINAKLDLFWQANKNHSIKTGVLLTSHTLNNNELQIRNANYGTDLETLATYNENTNTWTFTDFYVPQVLDNTSIYSDIYTVYPIEISAYIQDKMEFEDMVFDIGLRYDYFDPNVLYPSNWRNPANQDQFADPSKMSQYVETKPQTQISPRLGLSYRLGKRAALHFSYGHFFQMPPLYALYQNAAAWVVAPNDYQTTMGNPNLEAQKTVQYEVGLWQDLGSGMDFELTLYYRDMYNLLSAQVITTYNQIEYGLYDNKDYGNVKGLTLKYNVNYKNITAFLNYTLQYTRANADNPLQNFNRAGQSTAPITSLIALEWDQRHTLNFTLGYHEELWGATATTFYNSGTPYSWTPLGNSRQALVALLPNNAYKPMGVTTDLFAYYSIPVSGNLKMRFTLNIYNLFDNLNEIWVDGTTGRAYTAIIRETDIAKFHSDFTDIYDSVENPSMFSAPRQIRFGLGIEF